MYAVHFRRGVAVLGATGVWLCEHLPTETTLNAEFRPGDGMPPMEAARRAAEWLRGTLDVMPEPEIEDDDEVA